MRLFAGAEKNVAVSERLELRRGFEWWHWFWVFEGEVGELVTSAVLYWSSNEERGNRVSFKGERKEGAAKKVTGKKRDSGPESDPSII